MHQVQQIRQLTAQNVNQGTANGLTTGNAEDVVHVLLINMIAAERHQLVQHTLGITHTTLGNGCNGVCCSLCECYTLIGGNVDQMVSNDIRGDGAQVKALTAGKNGGQNFVRFRGGKDEHHMGRRLLKRLQQCVERFLGEHVHLVNVHNAVIAA